METDNFWQEPEEIIYNDNAALIGRAIEIFISQKELKSLGYDDLFQEGSIALIKAIRTFDGRKDTEFSTYATTCIRNALRQYAMKNKYGGTRVGNRTQYKVVAQGEEAANAFAQNHAVQMCGYHDFPDGFASIGNNKFYPPAEEEAVFNLRVEEAMKNLPSDLYRNCVKLFLETESLTKTARILGASIPTVWRAVNAFKNYLVGTEK